MDVSFGEPDVLQLIGALMVERAKWQKAAQLLDAENETLKAQIKSATATPPVSPRKTR